MTARSSPARVFIALALCAGARLFAAPGDIVSLELERRMSPAEIDAFIAPLYEGSERPAARYAVDVYALRFESLYPDGAKAVAFTQVFIPSFEGEKPALRPVYAFGPGSTGLTDACRPSREHVAGIRWGLYRAHVLSHAGQGTLGVLPDYLGFGDPERDQYYMLAKAEAATMLDALRALRAMLKRGAFPGVSGTRNFVAGFSQGGHAAFAAAEFRAAYAPDIKLSGIIGYGPSTDLIALFKEFPDVAPMALYTFREYYGKAKVNPDLALADRFAPTLDFDVTRQCVGGMQSYYPIDPTKLFNKDFSAALLGGTLEAKYPGIYQALRENSPGLLRHGIPALIFQGTDDIVVSVRSQEAFAAAARAKGNPVELRILDKVRHDTRQASFAAAQAWMKARLR